MLKHLMKFSVVASLSSVLLAATLVQAHADGRDNGVKYNGVKHNGIKFNGFRYNGGGLNAVAVNGVKQNGIKQNGIRHNGGGTNGVAGSFAAFAIHGIELPPPR